MSVNEGPDSQPVSRLRSRQVFAVAVSALGGGLAGAAAASAASEGWAGATLAGASVGFSGGVVSVWGHRRDISAAVTAFVAAMVGGAAGLFVAFLVVRGDSEVVASLLGTSAMAAVLGLICAALVRDALDDSDFPDG